MPEFVLLVPVRVVARVRADSLEKALDGLRALECFELDYTSGDVRLTEATVLAEESECIDIDGHDLSEVDPTCRYCHESLVLIGGKWLDDGDGHPEICPGQGLGKPHEPWKTFKCYNCGHAAREDEFMPTDGRPDEYACPKCEATNVEALFNFQ